LRTSSTFDGGFVGTFAEINNVRDLETERVLHTANIKKNPTYRFLSKGDRRGPEALPAPLVDKSLLFFACFLVHDGSRGRHRVRFETRKAGSTTAEGK
jgi:hypothetical protein